MTIRTSIDDAIDSSFKRSIHASDAERARFLLETLGPRITAVGMGLRDARPVKSWAADEARPRGKDGEERLRILYRIADAVTAVEGPRVAASFVRGANPELDDRSVLSVLSTTAPDDALESRLMGVVRDFLAS